MHLIFLFFQLYFLLMVILNRVMNSFIMAVLLLALSQVTCLTFVMEGKYSGTLHIDSVASITLCSIPICLTTLYNACPSCLPLCTLLSCVKPIRAHLSSHFPVVGSSIQCAVTTKYPSTLPACQASHVKLTSPWTVWHWEMMRKEC